MADHKAEGDRPPPACCQRCCAQVLTCCNIYPKPTDNDLHRPKCCGVKKISCVRLLSTITVITGSGMVASTVLSFHEPCDVPLAPLMLIISICFICYGFMFCGLPERWYRCGSLTVATTMICWLVPANYFFFSSETCRMTSFTAKALDSRMFDIYSSTEIVLLALDTLIMFGCFACSITGCTTCINNGRHYYDKDDEIDQLYYKYIEEGGQLHKDTSEPLLSGEDVQDEDNGSNLVLDSNESGGDGVVERGIKGDGTRVRRKKTRDNCKQNRRRKGGGGRSSGGSEEHSDVGQQSNSDFYTTTAGEMSNNNHHRPNNNTKAPSSRINRSQQQERASRSFASQNPDLSSDTDESDGDGH